MRRAVGLLVIPALVGAGCGSTARIERRDGILLRAKIVDSDAKGLWLQGRNEGPPVWMARSEVHDITHPGTPSIIVGAGMLGAWGLFMTSPAFRDELIHGNKSDVSVMARPITVMLTVPAAIFMAWGASRYFASARAARAFDAAEPLFEIVPRHPDAPPAATLMPPATLAPPSPATASPPAKAPAPPAEPATRSPERWVAPPPPA